MFGYTVRMASGTASDKVQKRKPLVLIGYSLSAVSKPFFALAGGWADVFVLRSADRVGKETVLSISYGVFLVSTVLMFLSTNSAHAYLPRSMAFTSG